MTTMTTPRTTETTSADLLRAVADLIEARPDISGPHASVHFVLLGPAAASAVADVAAALPCQWQAEIARNGDDWLHLQAAAGGAEVLISAKADAVCTATGTGTRTVTVTATTWEPQPVLAAVVGGAPIRDKR